jgi:uncharacterized protein
VNNSGLSAGSEYACRVRAYNAAGGSEYAECASAITGLEGAPKSPAQLKAVSMSSNKIEITWQDNSGKEDNFNIYKKAGSGVWILIHTTAGPDIEAYSDTSATGNEAMSSYSYYVTACNASGCSPATNGATVPFRPLNLKALPKAMSGIKLTWQDKNSNESGHSVYRKNGGCSGAGWQAIATTADNITTYTDDNVTKGNTYSYRVGAFETTFAMPYASGYSLMSVCRGAVAP